MRGHKRRERTPGGTTGAKAGTHHATSGMNGLKAPIPRPEEVPMSRWIFAAAIAATATCLASTAAAATPVPKLLSCSGIALSRPAGTVVLSCADGNTELKGTHWRSWGAHEAIGSTDFGVNLCTPTCVASRMRFFAASTVTLRDPERTSRGLLFSRAVIAYTLDGHSRTFTAYLAT
jgi:hypothetical protein